jgi:uncharacterized membrane protein
MDAMAKAKKTLTQAELFRRRDIVNFARANVELEGFYCTDQTYIDLNERYARGEIEAEEIDAYVDNIIMEIDRARQGE